MGLITVIFGFINLKEANAAGRHVTGSAVVVVRHLAELGETFTIAVGEGNATEAEALIVTFNELHRMLVARRAFVSVVLKLAGANKQNAEAEEVVVVLKASSMLVEAEVVWLVAVVIAILVAGSTTQTSLLALASWSCQP